MPVLLAEECDQCRELENTHDEEMDAYIRLIDQQGRLFRIGRTQAGRDLDIRIVEAKTKRQAAVDALHAHQACHSKNH